jgi:hypothetical protein
MTMNDDNKELNKVETPSDEQETRPETQAGEGEFKVTVRKLEMPVRPRGVLAE